MAFLVKACKQLARTCQVFLIGIDRLTTEARSSKLAECHHRYIDEVMTEDNELTSRQLFALFGTKYLDVQVSISTIKRARKHLGWISKKTRYCALIREANKEKIPEWCKERLDLDLDESQRKTSYHKIGQPSRLCGRAKHPAKVHI